MSTSNTVQTAQRLLAERESWRCWGCRHLPDDPRVIHRAQASEVGA
jgi:hypothetical protein